MIGYPFIKYSLHKILIRCQDKTSIKDIFLICSFYMFWISFSPCKLVGKNFIIQDSLAFWSGTAETCVSHPVRIMGFFFAQLCHSVYSWSESRSFGIKLDGGCSEQQTVHFVHCTEFQIFTVLLQSMAKKSLQWNGDIWRLFCGKWLYATGWGMVTWTAVGMDGFLSSCSIRTSCSFLWFMF